MYPALDVRRVIMELCRAVRLLALVVSAGMATLACGLGDVFKASGLESVVVKYQGDTVLIRGTTVPFTATVLAGGVALDQPRLSVVSSDTAVVRVTAGYDSLTAKKPGFSTLTIRLESSFLTDSAPTLAQALRVKP
jgi:hypothetical protein